ncbi:hypothetical protein [Kribbella sp. ALI-6-A]|uniref:hypothetical protein n=1 Tax=Kribbella sp. ALI-6-A TaxID=1933817 RepID=UPI00117B3226|nr:hypothetical protein [Kribbella sp. ALI-6-A]
MIALRILRSLLLAASGAVIALAQLNLPKDFWNHHSGTLWTSVSVLALLVLVDTAKEVDLYLRAHQIREYDKDLRSALSGAAGSMMTLFGVSWDQVAIRYYRQRSWLHRRRLAPVKAMMAGADVEESHHSIKPGIGLVGTAFETQEAIAIEWAEFVREATFNKRAAWETRPAHERFNMSWGQLQSHTAPPEGMIANPTFAGADGEPYGCVLISGALKLPDLESEGTRRILGELASALEQIGPPPRGWWSAHER